MKWVTGEADRVDWCIQCFLGRELPWTCSLETRTSCLQKPNKPWINNSSAFWDAWWSNVRKQYPYKVFFPSVGLMWKYDRIDTKGTRLVLHFDFSFVKFMQVGYKNFCWIIIFFSICPVQKKSYGHSRLVTECHRQEVVIQWEGFWYQQQDTVSSWAFVHILETLVTDWGPLFQPAIY